MKDTRAMHLIFVHQDPSPVGGPEAICTLKLIEALLDQGVRISVVARKPISEPLRRDGVEFHQVGYPDRESLIERLTRMANLYPEEGWYWALAASKKIQQICQAGNVTAVCSRAMPFISHVACWHAKKNQLFRWAAHFSDPWPPIGYSEGQRHSKLRMRWHQRIAAKADVLTYPCDRVARFCQEHQWPPTRNYRRPAVSILPHIAGQFSRIKPFSRENENRLVYMHCGGFSETRRPDEFLRAWASFIERHPQLRARLLFRHVGPKYEPLSNLAYELQVAETVEQTGPCNYQDSLRHMVSADALVLIDSYKIVSSVYFPSKLSDYIGANKPILAMSPRDGTVSDLLGEDYPLRADPWDYDCMTATLEYALNAICEQEWKGAVNLKALQDKCDPVVVAQSLIDSFQKPK